MTTIVRAPAAPAPPVVDVRGAVVAFGERPVLRGIDLTVRRGEVVAVLGANGSGKSTLIRTVLGLVPMPGRHGQPLRRRPGRPARCGGSGAGSGTCRSAWAPAAACPPP